MAKKSSKKTTRRSVNPVYAAAAAGYLRLSAEAGARHEIRERYPQEDLPEDEIRDTLAAAKRAARAVDPEQDAITRQSVGYAVKSGPARAHNTLTRPRPEQNFLPRRCAGGEGDAAMRHYMACERLEQLAEQTYEQELTQGVREHYIPKLERYVEKVLPLVEGAPEWHKLVQDYNNAATRPRDPEDPLDPPEVRIKQIIEEEAYVAPLKLGDLLSPDESRERIAERVRSRLRRYPSYR